MTDIPLDFFRKTQFIELIKILLFLYKENRCCPKEIREKLNYKEITIFSYLKKLKSMGLIRSESGMYELTEKGINFIRGIKHNTDIIRRKTINRFNYFISVLNKEGEKEIIEHILNIIYPLNAIINDRIIDEEVKLIKEIEKLEMEG